MGEISFCFTVYDEIIKFTVPISWAVEWIEKNQEMTLEEFEREYTSDESNEMYCDAILEGVLIKEE